MTLVSLCGPDIWSLGFYSGSVSVGLRQVSQGASRRAEWSRISRSWVLILALHLICFIQKTSTECSPLASRCAADHVNSSPAFFFSATENDQAGKSSISSQLLHCWLHNGKLMKGWNLVWSLLFRWGGLYLVLWETVEDRYEKSTTEIKRQITASRSYPTTHFPYFIFPWSSTTDAMSLP